MPTKKPQMPVRKPIKFTDVTRLHERVTAQDIPGSGLAKRAGRALQNRKSRLDEMIRKSGG